LVFRFAKRFAFSSFSASLGRQTSLMYAARFFLNDSPFEASRFRQVSPQYFW
jgi:hypothetical protein